MEIWYNKVGNDILLNSSDSTYDLNVPLDSGIAFKNGIFTWNESTNISVPTSVMENSVMNTLEYTISYWKKNNNAPLQYNHATSSDIFLANSTNDNIYLKVYTAPYNSNRFKCVLGNGMANTFDIDVVPSNIDFNEWNHYAIRLSYNRDSNSHLLSVYINNTLVGNTSVNKLEMSPLTETAVFLIGDDNHVYDRNNRFSIRDFRFFSKAIDTLYLYNIFSQIISYHFDNSDEIQNISNSTTFNTNIIGGFSDGDPYIYTLPFVSKLTTNPISLPLSLNSYLSISNGITLGYWKKHVSLDTSLNEFIVENYLYIRSNEASVLSRSLDIPFTYELNRWYYVTISIYYNNSILYIKSYIDGNVISEYQTKANLNTNVTPSYIYLSNPTMYIQEFNMYNKALSTSDIYEHFKFYKDLGSLEDSVNELQFSGSIVNPIRTTSNKRLFGYPATKLNLDLWLKLDSLTITDSINNLALATSGNTIIPGVHNVNANQLTNPITGTDTNGLLMDKFHKDLTVSFWHKGSNLDISMCHFNIKIDATGIGFTLDGSNSNLSVNSTYQFDQTEPHLWTFVYDSASRASIWFDGLLVQSTVDNSFTRFNTEQTNISIATDNLQDLRFYSNPLNYYEIQNLYDFIHGRDIDDLLIMYNFHQVDLIRNNAIQDQYDATVVGTIIKQDGAISKNQIQFTSNSSIEINSGVDLLLNTLDGEFTICFWNNNSNLDIAFLQDSTSNIMDINISMDTIRFKVDSNEISIANTSMSSYNHYLFRYMNDDGLYIYRNGYAISKELIFNDLSSIKRDPALNLSFKISGDDNTVLENLRIYNRSLRFNEIQKVFYDTFDKTDDLLIWYRFTDYTPYNIANENNDYDAKIVGSNISQYIQYPSIFSYKWDVNSDAYLSIEDNTTSNIIYNVTILNGSLISDNPLELIRGRRHVINWPSDNMIKITDIENTTSTLVKSWITYDSINKQTIVDYPYTDFEYYFLYYYVSILSQVNTIPVIGPMPSIYGLLTNLISTDYSICFWNKVGTTLLIERDNQYPILNINVSPSSFNYRVGLGDGTMIGKESVSLTSDNNWHHWAFTYQTLESNTILRSYRDGVMVDQDTTSNFDGFIGLLYNDPYSFKLGLGSSVLETYLMDFRVYNTLLSVQEIENIHNNYEVRLTDDLVLSDGMKNPYSLLWTGNNKDNFVSISDNFIKYTQNELELHFEMWIYPIDSEFVFQMDIGNRFTINMNISILDLIIDASLAGGNNKYSIKNESLNLSSTWYKIDIIFTDYKRYFELTATIKDINNIEITKQPIKRYYSDAIRYTNSDKSYISSIKKCKLYDLRLYGADKNLIIHYVDSFTNTAIDMYHGTIIGTGDFTSNLDNLLNQNVIDCTNPNNASIELEEDLLLRLSMKELSITYWKKDYDLDVMSFDFITEGDIANLIEIYSDTNLTWKIYNDTGSMNISHNNLSTNEWIYYAFLLRYNGLNTSMYIYINGVLANSFKQDLFIPFKGINYVNSYLGGNPQKSDNSISYYEDFRVYNRCLGETDIFRFFFGSTIIRSDRIVHLRLNNVNDIKNEGSLNTGILFERVGTLFNDKGIFYNGSNTSFSGLNKGSILWRHPTGNEYIYSPNGKKLLQQIDTKGRFSIVFKQKVDVYDPTTEYVIFDADKKIKISMLNNVLSFTINNVYSLTYNLINTRFTLNDLWISWGFSMKIKTRYLYMKIFKDAKVVAKKTFDNSSIFTINDGNNRDIIIGRFLRNVNLEDFNIFDRIITIDDFPVLGQPIKIKNDFSVNLQDQRVSYNLNEYFKGTNIRFEIMKDDYDNVKIEADVVTIFPYWRNVTYDVIVKAYNVDGYATLKITVDEEIPPAIVFTYPQVSLTTVIPLDFSTVGDSGSAQRQAFETLFISDIASALDISTDLVVIDDIRVGSIIVDFTILPDPLNVAVVPAQLAVGLKDQENDPNSKLKQNTQIVKLAQVNVPEEVVQMALYSDKIFVKIEDNLPKTIDLVQYTKGLKVNFKLTLDPYNNAKIKNNTLELTGNFRNTQYEVKIEASNPTNVITLSFMVIEPALLPPAAKASITILLGNNEYLVDLREYISGGYLETFTIISNPYSNALLVRDSIYKVVGNYRNTTYNVEFEATNMYNEKARWILSIIEAPLPPEILISDGSLTLTNNEIVFDLKNIFSGSNLVYEIDDNYKGGFSDFNAATIYSNILSVKGDYRGAKYTIKTSAKNIADKVTWNLDVVEAYPSSPSLLTGDQSNILGIQQLTYNLSTIFQGYNLKYDVKQYIVSPTDVGIRDYFEPADYQVFIQNPPWGRYHAKYWNTDTNVLTDLSGNNNHARLLQGVIKRDRGTGFGTTHPIDYIYGDENAILEWPRGSAGNTFTICSISRYTGTIRQRILSSKDNGVNIIHGHWNGNRGIVLYDRFSTSMNSKGVVTDWLVCIGKNGNTAPANVILDNVESGISVGYGGNKNARLSINKTEPSEWALSDVMIWDKLLSDDDMRAVSQIFVNYLQNGTPIKKEFAPVVDYKNVYNNVQLANNTLTIQANNRGILYDVLVSAENSKGKVYWKSTVRELDPALTLVKTDVYLSLVWGDYTYPLTDFIRGENVTYTFSGGYNNNTKILNGNLVITADYRNRNYTIYLTGVNNTGIVQSVIYITETSKLKPEVIDRNYIFVINDSIIVDPVFNGLVDALILEQAYGNVVVTGKNSLQITNKKNGTFEEIFIIGRNASGLEFTSLKLLYTPFQEGYAKNLVPTVNIYGQFDEFEYDLMDIVPDGSTYSIIYNPYAFENNIVKQGSIFTVMDNYRGTYDIGVQIDLNQYIIRINERTDYNVINSMLVNYVFNNTINNVVKTSKIADLIDMRPKQIQTGLILMEDAYLVLTPFDGVLNYIYFDPILYTNIRILNNNTIKIINKNSNSFERIEIFGYNDHGSTKLTLDIIYYSKQTHNNPTFANAIPYIELYMEYDIIEFDLAQLGSIPGAEIILNPYGFENNLKIMNNKMYLYDNKRGTYDILIRVNSNIFIVRIHERDEDALMESMKVRYSFQNGFKISNLVY